MTKHIPILLFTLTCTALPLWAEEGHDHGHDHSPIKGPNGGKVVEVEEVHVEFYVTPERIAEVRYFDESMQPLPIDGRKAEVIARAAEGTAKLPLVEKDGALVSDKPLPEGAPYQIVLRVQPSKDAKLENLRIAYNTELCGDCKLAEYACICEHHE